MTDWGERRRSLGLKQEELADLLGISRTALSHIETGKSKPSRKTQARLEHVLDPLENPVRMIHGEGVLATAEMVRNVAIEEALPWALTLDMATWLLTEYQTPAAIWVYVRPLKRWIEALKNKGAKEASSSERADMMLLRGTEKLLENFTEVRGFRIAPLHQVMEDCANLSGRHALDAARLYFAFPEYRPLGFRLDPAVVLKVWEEVGPST